MDIRADFAASSLIADARRKEGLEDFGPGEFTAALEVLTADYPGADLSELGAHIVRSGLVHSLRMRLRSTELRR
ncbi:MAG: hypothetical protein ACJ72O_06975, partial [Marmoricola sp.]